MDGINPKKVPYFSKYFQPQLGPSSKEMTNARTSHIHFYKELEEELMGGEFIEGMMKNWLEKYKRPIRTQLQKTTHKTT